MRFIAALLLCVCPAFANAGEWLTNYAEGYEASKKADKPIFVYFTDAGRDQNWKAPFEGKNELTDAYILVVADKNTKEGAEIFKTFENEGTKGAVVIERGRDWQYFRTERELNSDDLTKVLTECKEAKGKPTSSVLNSVASQVIEASTTNTQVMPSSSYCPNCQRFR